MDAHASSIIELIGGDPGIQPRAPNPTIIFSPEAKSTDGRQMDPTGKQLKIEMWIIDPITGIPIPIYEGMVPPEYMVHRGKKSHWALTHDGKVATGIEQLTIRRLSEDTLSIRFKDSGVALPNADYSKVCFRIWIGPDDGSACHDMSQQGSWWRVAK